MGLWAWQKPISPPFPILIPGGFPCIMLKAHIAPEIPHLKKSYDHRHQRSTSHLVGALHLLIAEILDMQLEPVTEPMRPD